MTPVFVITTEDIAGLFVLALVAVVCLGAVLFECGARIWKAWKGRKR